MTVTNGGYVDVKNLEAAGNPVSRKYYKGKQVTREYDFTFDFDKPYHCTSGQSCIDGMLTAPDITANVRIMKSSHLLSDYRIKLLSRNHNDIH